ncbi:transposase [Nitrosomonas aestuarii]|uniref:Transposase n=1 Tax=Nitrosomonas aestuarii TaxID=52441 RepID=A0A1I4HK61_9PROT|nr:transposase [Nitrosomonas aestuarii]
MGIRSNMLYRWKQQQEHQSSKECLSEDERAELNRLRKEVKNLRTKKEILKKASGIDAQEMK